MRNHIWPDILFQVAASFVLCEKLSGDQSETITKDKVAHEQYPLESDSLNIKYNLLFYCRKTTFIKHGNKELG